MDKIQNIESIAAKYSMLLIKAGIEDQLQLLTSCASRKARQQLAEQTKIHCNLINKWTGQADLVRINGVGQDFSELLSMVDICSVSDLCKANAQQLYLRMKKANSERPVTKNIPSEETIQDWIAQARTLPVIIEGSLR